MKKILVILIFLTSCGYQPLYSNKKFADFTFKDIELIGDIKINRQIVTTLNIEKNSENFQFNKIVLKNNKQIIETSKNSYKMILSVNLIIENKENILNEKFFSETFAYKKLDNKFDLSQYEKEVEKNLITKITEQMIVHLNL